MQLSAMENNAKKFVWKHHNTTIHQMITGKQEWGGIAATFETKENSNLLLKLIKLHF